MVRYVAIYPQGSATRTVGKAIPRLQPDLFSAVISVRYSRSLTVADWLLYTHQAMTQYDGCHIATVLIQAMGFLSVLGHVQDLCYNPAHFSQSRSQVILISVVSDYPRLPQTSPALKRGAGDEEEDYRVGTIPIPIPISSTIRESKSANVVVRSIMYIGTRRSPLLEIVSS